MTLEEMREKHPKWIVRTEQWNPDVWYAVAIRVLHDAYVALDTDKPTEAEALDVINAALEALKGPGT